MNELKRALIASTLGLLAIFAVASQSAQAHGFRAALAMHVSDATYLVEGRGERGAWTGTAFHIGDGYFVTAGHVVDGAGTLTVGGVVAVVVAYENTPGDFVSPDWALLFVREVPAETPKLEVACDATPGMFDHIAEYGAPSGWPLYSEGVIQGFRNDDTTIVYTMYPPLGAGASGAAVVDATTGRVIAIHIAGSEIGDGGDIKLALAWRVSAVPRLCP